MIFIFPLFSQFNLLIRFTTKAAMMSFSFGWLSAIIKVIATRALSAMRLKRS